MIAKRDLDEKSYSLYYNKLRGKILILIANDLTFGKKKDGLPEYSSHEIREFIKKHHTKIDLVIETIIQDYYAKCILESLNNPQYSWVANYLYDFIDTSL